MLEENIKLAKIHNFVQKFCQPSQIDKLKNYVKYQQILRGKKNNEKDLNKILKSIPFVSPTSINLDLTTSCNFACDHCVDLDILNNGIKFDYHKLQNSLDLLVSNGLKSVIIIGGGEPTVSPYFEKVRKWFVDTAAPLLADLYEKILVPLWDNGIQLVFDTFETLKKFFTEKGLP